jgi:hypothetical protein
MLTVDRRYFVCGEGRRHDHLEHFEVFAVSHFAMTYLWRLMHARPRFEPHAPLAFILELDPALENVHELKRRVVKVRLT